MDMSLDEYIALRKIGSDILKKATQSTSISKFDRINMQETKENCEMETDVTDGEQMPKLVPLEVSIPNYKPRKSVHERLGKRRVGDSESECESIHTSRLALYRPKFKNHISNRLQKNYMSEAMVQRNKIAITALHEYATEAMKHLKATDVEQGRLLVNSFANTFEALDNDVEGRKLQWDSSNTQAVSVDGPGIKFVKVRPDTSNMSLNQRFT